MSSTTIHLKLVDYLAVDRQFAYAMKARCEGLGWKYARAVEEAATHLAIDPNENVTRAQAQEAFYAAFTDHITMKRQAKGLDREAGR